MQPPIAKKVPVVTNNFNQENIDNYHWLRAKNWPEQIDQDILDYLNCENEYYNHIMNDYRSNEDILFKELVSRVKLSDQTTPILHDNYYYYSYTEDDSDYSIYCRRKDSMENELQIIFNPNIESRGEKFYQLDAFNINKTHNLLAYSVDILGNERYQIKIRDLNNNINLDDIINNSIGDVCWNSEGFYYIELDDKWRRKKIYYHNIGSSQKNDILIFEEKQESFSVNIYESADKKYLLIESSSSNSNETWYLPIENQHESPKVIYKRKNDCLYYVDHRMNYFYIRTNDQAINFKIIKIDIMQDFSQYIEIIPHNETVYLNNFYIYKNRLVIENKENGLSKINITDFDCKNIKSISFPEESYALSIIYTDYNYDSVRYNYSSLNNPDTVIEYSFDSETKNIIKIREIPSGFDKSLYKVERIYAPSEDVLVPISLIYRKDLFENNNPLYLYGYGSYGISVSANFRTSIFSLIDRGFVYAIAHIRGGDDLGYKWYENAKFLNKKRTFNDFINCAKYLISSNYTSYGSITICGGSAGGMLIGSVINMESGLFKLAIADVPFVDVLNTMLDDSLPLTPGEYLEWGNPKYKEYYQYIKSYSPYDNVKKQNFPTLYVTSGLYDPRVTYWEPAKWVAKIRDLKTDDNILVLQTNMDQGHKGASKRFNYLREIAKEYNFILKTYGIM